MSDAHPHALTFRVASYDGDAKILRRIVADDPFVRHFAHIAYCNRIRFARGNIIVAEQQDEIVGFAVITALLRARQTKINILATAPDRRSRGIGRALLHHVIEQQEYPTVTLDVRIDNVRAIAFYEREGFHNIGRDDRCFTMTKRTGKRGTLF